MLYVSEFNTPVFDTLTFCDLMWLRPQRTQTISLFFVNILRKRLDEFCGFSAFADFLKKKQGDKCD